MASLQPACHTKNFSVDYYLRVILEYDGCICCVDLPDSRMKMTIIPLVNPDAMQVEPPSDFNPTELGAVSPDLTESHSD